MLRPESRGFPAVELFLLRVPTAALQQVRPLNSHLGASSARAGRWLSDSRALQILDVSKHFPSCTQQKDSPLGPVGTSSQQLLQIRTLTAWLLVLNCLLVPGRLSSPAGPCVAEGC